VLPYAAYLRVYEPLAAFPEPERGAWAEYAGSAGRSSRLPALQAEQAESLRRLLSVPPIVAPRHESPHAYVRRAGGAVYVCPSQARLRSWESFSRFRDSLYTAVTEAFVPAAVADRASAEFERWKEENRTVRTHIRSTMWQVPLAWFALCSRGTAPGPRFATRR
jgi:hypothetical protein